VSVYDISPCSYAVFSPDSNVILFVPSPQGRGVEYLMSFPAMLLHFVGRARLHGQMMETYLISIHQVPPTCFPPRWNIPVPLNTYRLVRGMNTEHNEVYNTSI
jgi:hypothetical protein